MSLQRIKLKPQKQGILQIATCNKSRNTTRLQSPEQNMIVEMEKEKSTRAFLKGKQ